PRRPGREPVRLRGGGATDADARRRNRGAVGAAHGAAEGGGGGWGGAADRSSGGDRRRDRLRGPGRAAPGAGQRLGRSGADPGAEVLGGLGANGSGKTTLMRSALGLQRLTAGSARLDGREVGSPSEAERASLAGYLPQERRVGWNLPAWRIAALGAVSQPPARAHAAALAALNEVGMGALVERGVLDMSGG